MTTAERGQFITCRIHKGISNVLQRHTAIEDINYIISSADPKIYEEFKMEWWYGTLK